MGRGQHRASDLAFPIAFESQRALLFQTAHGVLQEQQLLVGSSVRLCFLAQLQHRRSVDCVDTALEVGDQKRQGS